MATARISCSDKEAKERFGERKKPSNIKISIFRIILILKWLSAWVKRKGMIPKQEMPF